MSLPLLDATTNFLPPGRHLGTVGEVEERFVIDFPSSTTRRELFEIWKAKRILLQHLIDVERQWVAGSFISTKKDPPDIDECSIVSGEKFEKLPLEVKQAVSFLFLNGHVSRDITKCDSFPIFEFPPGTPGHNKYLAMLNYWENLWGHTREDASGDKHSRGYVEVVNEVP